MSPDVRLLAPGDQSAVEKFLDPHTDASLFLCRNLRDGGLRDGPERYRGTWAGVFDDGRLAAVAQHTRFGSILVQAPIETAAVAREAARGSGRPVGGFVGPRDQALAARRALGFDGVPMRMESHEGLYALPLETDGTLVAYQQFNAMLPDVVQVGGVWTPPDLRSRGYARAVVAGALLAVRATGVQRAILFTADTNVPARTAYAALGFTRIGDWALIFLEEPTRPLI